MQVFVLEVPVKRPGLWTTVPRPPGTGDPVLFSEDTAIAKYEADTDQIKRVIFLAGPEHLHADGSISLELSTVAEVVECINER